MATTEEAPAAPESPAVAWYALTPEEAAEKIGVDPARGLSATDAAYANWGTPEQRPIRRADPATLRAQGFAEGSMGPKVLAACEFVEKTGKRAVIGSMADTPALLAGTAGTSVTLDADGLEMGDSG